MSDDFDLGRDHTRIKDKRDAARQLVTVQEILSRFYGGRSASEWPIQVLADEVGMGKTFVALGVAYSVLKNLRSAAVPDTLRGCYQSVLIITPQNSALFNKWKREVGEFVKRCVREELHVEAARTFRPEVIERIDDLYPALRNPQSRVIVTHMGVFAGGKLLHYDVKRRFMLGVLFRHWGPSIRVEARERLLRGAPEGWPRDPYRLTELTETERQQLGFTEREAFAAFDEIHASDRWRRFDGLLELCRKLSEPYTRGRADDFVQVERMLGNLYRDTCVAMIRKALPLVIVDEAHNWKNGPQHGTNGYKNFRDWIAPHTRRALLLTATPFQLHPSELLELLRIGEDLEACPTVQESAAVRARVQARRTQVIDPVPKKASSHARMFARAWARLPRTVAAQDLATAWTHGGVAAARTQLFNEAALEGQVDSRTVDRIVEHAVADLDPDIQELIREALRLYAYNHDLADELGEFVIRHRRRADHRAFRVGNEYVITSVQPPRADTHVVHAAPGVDVRGDGELPHYLLMRCVASMKKRGRTSLGSALTGCYSTLLHSAEGRAVQSALQSNGPGAGYMDLLMRVVRKDEDERHPKLAPVAAAALRNWEAGEKTLIFCFRANTAERLRDIIDERIRKSFSAREN